MYEGRVNMSLIDFLFKSSLADEMNNLPLTEEDKLKDQYYLLTQKITNLQNNIKYIRNNAILDSIYNKIKNYERQRLAIFKKLQNNNTLIVKESR